MDAELARIPAEALPPALQIGVPPALSAIPTLAFWGKSLEDMPAEQQQLLGVQPNRCVAPEVDAIMNAHISACGDTQEQRARLGVARRIMNLIKHTGEDTMPALPSTFCTQRRPKRAECVHGR